ncbi:MAG: peptidoglycan editing factor PgeF [Lachnospiraceae bacterium]
MNAVFPQIKTTDSRAPIPMLLEKQGVAYMEFPGLKKIQGIHHLFSTRFGGVSENEFSTMNLSFTRGDREEAVKENYQRIAAVLGTRPQHMVATYQTHTTNVMRVTTRERGLGVTQPKQMRDVDGLFTNEKGVTLLAYFADCVPLYFVDPEKMVIGLAHSGWKGTCNGIGYEMILAMECEFGCVPENIHVAIGPSICSSCYEVSEDLFDEFANHFWPRFGSEGFQLLDTQSALFRRKDYGKYHLNLQLANQLIFRKAGILEKHMECTNVCTCCNPELLFSHRATQGKRGNLCAFLGIDD